MFTGRAIATYLAAVAIGASAGGVLGYEFHRLTPQERLPISVEPGKYAPVIDSKMSELFKPLTDVLR
jgi:hypothetical protein